MTDSMDSTKVYLLSVTKLWIRLSAISLWTSTASRNYPLLTAEDCYVYTHTHFKKQLPMSKIRSLHASNSCRKYLKANRTTSTQEHKKEIK